MSLRQGAHEGEKLIHELQALFSHMLLTERRYVDPQPLLRFTGHIGCVLGCYCSGVAILPVLDRVKLLLTLHSHSAQEDPTELLLSLLEKIREGVRHTKRAKWDADDVEPMVRVLVRDLGLHSFRTLTLLFRILAATMKTRWRRRRRLHLHPRKRAAPISWRNSSRACKSKPCR